MQFNKEEVLTELMTLLKDIHKTLISIQRHLYIKTMLDVLMAHLKFRPRICNIFKEGI